MTTFIGGKRRAGSPTAGLVDVTSVVLPITEKRFMAQVIRSAELFGWRIYHTFDSRRSNAGFPDLVLVRRPRVVFAELKAQRTPVTADQRWWLDALRASGQEVYLWRPSMWEEVERVLR